MPYLPDRDRRKELDGGAPAQDGAERTYNWFVYFLKAWHKAPGFATAFDLQKVVHEVAIDPDDQAAKELAWDEFKRRFLHPHEQAAMVRNGDVFP